MRIGPEQVESYLRAHGYPSAKLTALVPLGADVQEGLKAHGYGRPLRAQFLDGGTQRDIVIRTMAPDKFGHDRRADRMDGMMQAYDFFGEFPRHIQSLDLGVVTARGELCSIADGEPFLITDYVEGDLYAADLTALSRLDRAPADDIARAEALADYLATVHAHPVAPDKRRRAIRDLVGHGEGIFGLLDAYETNDEVAPPQRLIAIEHAAVDWRWRLKAMDTRARRTHGDFHPFNILFRKGTDFSVLDASRGAAGDPADDVTALTINYIFFALSDRGAFDGALLYVWDAFWERYLDASQDDEILEVVAPFFAWRTLVVSCPAWYPNLDPHVRDKLLSFAEQLLEGARFRPDKVGELLTRKN